MGQVNISLAAAQARLHNAREERDQFYEANNQIVTHLKTKKELKPSIDRIGKFVDNLKSLREGSGMASGVGSLDAKELSPRKNLEAEYLDYEAKIITIFSVVDNMKEQFYAQEGKISRKDDAKVKELLDNIERLREEFESIERPDLEMENPSSEANSPRGKLPGNPLHPPLEATEQPKEAKDEHPESPEVKAEQVLDAEAELAKLESEFGKVNQDYSAEEVGDWEFDELERELRSGDSATTK
ncbi:hypothetical protein U1Q18_050722 [Sarracenia purpurea var. burkii]